MILFLDLETTGFDPRTDRVLEVAAILTDDKLVKIDEFTTVVRLDPATHRTFIDPVVVKMHTVNGLWNSCLADDAAPVETVDELLTQWINLHRDFSASPLTTTLDPIYLAGNSIHFDRAFMTVHMPKALGLLHYRQIDISSLNEFAKRCWPEVYNRRPAPGHGHRALADADESWRTAIHYAKHTMHIGVSAVML